MFKRGDCVVVKTITELNIELDNVRLGDVGEITYIDHELCVVCVDIRGKSVILFPMQICKSKNNLKL